MCLVNPELDPDVVVSVMSAVAKAKNVGDLAAVAEYIKHTTRSEYLRKIATQAMLVNKDAAATLYMLGKNYIYLSYISAMITAAVEGITSSRYSAGWYYPRVECCAALNAIKSAWLHFLAPQTSP